MIASDRSIERLTAFLYPLLSKGVLTVSEIQEGIDYAKLRLTEGDSYDEAVNDQAEVFAHRILVSHE